MASPRYRVVIRKFLNTTTYAPGDIVAEIQNAKNVGWAYYVNDVPECFFTINQDDPKAAEIAPYTHGDGYVEIYRNGVLVWAGLLLESNESETDVIFYAYGWACELYWQHTDWGQTWTAAQVNTIISDLIDHAQGKTDSMTTWWTKGTIQAPVTTSGGATPIELPEYKTYRKRILLAIRELTALSGSDTTNRVWWEVTPDGTFNFWKNKGTDLTTIRWAYPGNILRFQRLRIPAHRRNVMGGVGSSPRDVLLQTADFENTTDRTARGRREEYIYLSWVRDQTELNLVTRHRLRRAIREESHVRLYLGRNAVEPYPVGPYSLMDGVPVKISKGVTQMDDTYQIVGQEVYVIDGEERVVPLIQDIPPV